VPPLIFFTLVENALKFAIQTDEPKVQIVFKMNANEVELIVINNCLENNYLKAGTKMGLSNLKRRLEVIYTKYTLDFFEENKTFKVVLKLWELPLHV